MEATADLTSIKKEITSRLKMDFQFNQLFWTNFSKALSRFQLIQADKEALVGYFALKAQKEIKSPPSFAGEVGPFCIFNCGEQE